STGAGWCACPCLSRRLPVRRDLRSNELAVVLDEADQRRATRAGDDFYRPCASVGDSVVTVQAAAAKVTGDGWFAIGTGRTAFGFNAIPQAGGTWTGQIQVISNNGKSKFDGKAVLSLDSSGSGAKWSGSGVWNGTSGYTYAV